MRSDPFGSFVEGALHPRSGRSPRALPIGLLLALLLAPAWSASAARLVEVRIGEYTSFTRVVLEFDSPVEARIETVVAPAGALEIQVRLPAESEARTVSTRSKRVGEISLASEAGETLVRIGLRGPGVGFDRAMLETPPRLVLDVFPADDKTPTRQRLREPLAWLDRTQIAVAASGPGKPPPSARAAAPAVVKKPPESPATRPAAKPPAPPVVAKAPPAEKEEPAAPPPAPVPQMSARSDPGPVYRVGAFELLYADAHPELPPLDELAQTEVVLGHGPWGYTAPGPGVDTRTIRLSDAFASSDYAFQPGAILAVNQAIVRALNERGFVAVLSEPDQRDIELHTGADQRPAGRTTLRIVVHVGRVKDARTFASGQRVHPDQRLDNPVHQQILERSPVAAEGGNDLIRKDVLDEYTARLNRHPGRRVDVLISPAREPGGAYLDYLVAELKPWFVYGGISNTGTDSTTKLRQRFGFTHTQLTNRDDILSIDYVTGNFNQVHSVGGFYDVPLGGHPWIREHVRLSPFGSYLRYDASVLGFSGKPFEGRGWWSGADLAVNVFQHEEFFLDLSGGLRFAHQKVENELLGTEGQSDFFLPRWGLHAQNIVDTNAFYLDLDFEANLPGVANTDQLELDNMGRFPVDDKWVVLRFDSAGYVYLEPLILGGAWGDPAAPQTSTLAHELYLAFRGQYAFDYRLIPPEMSIAGGLYTVRGYEEAAATGDTTLIGNVEYRLHVPRLFRPAPPLEVPYVGPFRWAPQQVYGEPDWDLIVRTFFDVGRVIRSDRTAFELNETLLGAGLGVELQLRRNLSARVDYGWILKSLETDSDQQVGDSRLNFAVRVLY